MVSLATFAGVSEDAPRMVNPRALTVTIHPDDFKILETIARGENPLNVARRLGVEPQEVMGLISSEPGRRYFDELLAVRKFQYLINLLDMEQVRLRAPSELIRILDDPNSSAKDKIAALTFAADRGDPTGLYAKIQKSELKVTHQDQHYDRNEFMQHGESVLGELCSEPIETLNIKFRDAQSLPRPADLVEPPSLSEEIDLFGDSSVPIYPCGEESPTPDDAGESQPVARVVPRKPTRAERKEENKRLWRERETR